MNQNRKFVAASVVAAVMTVLIGASNAEALQYDRITLPSSPKVLVLARGHIDQGDTQRLFNFLIALPTSDRIAGFVVDSPGGGLVEAEALAGVIRRAAFPIFVPPSGQCSSACFLLFAAAPRRVVADDARIGVHRPSDNGRETSASKIATAAMAKDAGELGVPQNIVWKLVQTPPERKTWLSQADFAAMGVSVVEGARRTGMMAASGDKTTDRGTIEAWLMMLNAH
jgi:hypothetical protein